MHKLISSTHNPTIKRLLQLQSKSRARAKEGGFVIEGLRELELCIKGAFVIEEIYFVPALVSLSAITRLFVGDPKATFIEISQEVYAKLAYRGGTEGVIAFAKAQSKTLQELVLPENPLILIAEAPEKPGNIGALLRTADAAGVDAFIIANPKTDLYNPNIIRSSVGCVFTNQVAIGNTEEIIALLKSKNINIYSAILQEAIPYQKQDFTGATAIVVGTEATGLSETWRKASTQNIIIPMGGAIDSMNVSVAAGILVFEAKRQRGF